jgi:outer membrane lipoprotein SlyB
MRKLLFGIVISGLALTASGAAQAKGCLKGAAVGGVVGHVAGHHAVAGAAAGCVIGHHQAKVKAREAAQAQQPAAQGAPSH